ncbi:MAG: SPOR domain-containing protein [Nitrospinae bacterium]|nr:SPOR domain-containing protein [Nitrospinota bacterium]
MAQYLKYFSFRLFFVLLLFFPAIYIFENFDFIEYSRFLGGDDKLFLLLIFLFLFLIASLTLDFIGKQRVHHRLEKVKEKREINLKEILAHFERLYSTTFSAFFTPQSGDTLRKKVIGQFADLLTADLSGNVYSKNILKNAIISGVATKNVQNYLTKTLCKQPTLKENDLICAEIIFKETNNSDLFEKIVDEYLTRRSTGIMARNIYKVALENDHKKSSDIVLLLLKEYKGKKEVDDLGRLVLEFNAENKKNLIEQTDLLIKGLDQSKTINEQELSVPQKYLINDASEIRRETKVIQLDSIHKEKEDSERDISVKPIKNKENELNGKTSNSKRKLLPIIFFLSIIFVLLVLIFNNNEPNEPVIETKVEEVIPEKADKPKDIIKSTDTNEVHSDKPFTIQLAAFKNKGDANLFMKGIKQHQKAVYVNVKVGEKNRSSWYRVRLGFFDNQTDARAFAEKLKEEGKIGSFYITSFEGGKWNVGEN